MKILLLGATGRVGSEILKLALDDRHEVTAFVRDQNRLNTKNTNLKVCVGNVLIKEDINKVIPNHDIVISALGTDGQETLSKGIPYIINAMQENGLRRIITVGTAGILNSRVSPELYRFQSSETKRRSPRSTRAAEDHRGFFELLAKCSLEWTIVCPTYLPDGEKLARYRYEKNFLPINGERISVADTSEFTYKQILSNEFLRSRVGIAY